MSVHVCTRVHVYMHMCTACVGAHARVCVCVCIHACVCVGVGGQWQEVGTILDNKTKKFRERYRIYSRKSKSFFLLNIFMLKSF